MLRAPYQRQCPVAKAFGRCTKGWHVFSTVRFRLALGRCMEAVRDQVQKNTGDVLWVDISFAGGLIKRRVEIKIRDNGTGIPPEVKEKVREEVRRDLGDMGGAIEVEVEIRFGIDSRIDNRVAGLLTKLGSLMTLGVVVDQRLEAIKCAPDKMSGNTNTMVSNSNSSPPRVTLNASAR